MKYILAIIIYFLIAACAKPNQLTYTQQEEDITKENKTKNYKL